MDRNRCPHDSDGTISFMHHPNVLLRQALQCQLNILCIGSTYALMSPIFQHCQEFLIPNLHHSAHAHHVDDVLVRPDTPSRTFCIHGRRGEIKRKKGSGVLSPDFVFLFSKTKSFFNNTPSIGNFFSLIKIQNLEAPEIIPSK